jgi:hypothetical protein
MCFVFQKSKKGEKVQKSQSFQKNCSLELYPRGFQKLLFLLSVHGDREEEEEEEEEEGKP